MSARTTAVIVSYNSRGVITEGLDEAARAHAAGDLEVVVVDNESRDGTPAYVRERYPWVRVIDAGGNLGFGRGCNLGLSATTTPYVLFLNPDAVLPVESLRTLVEFMDRTPRALMSAPATENYGGTHWQAAGGLPTPVTILRAALGRGGRPNFQRTIRAGEAPFQADWLGGGIMLIRCDGLRALGGFDPRFFLYFDETDLCKRAIVAGHDLWAVGEATARHAGGTAAKATGERLYRASIAEHYFRSRFYYLVKHFGWAAAVCTEVLELVALSARSLAKKALGRGGHELAERLSGPIMRLPDRPPPEPASQAR
jgi:GT2 family glycosyltransferase